MGCVMALPDGEGDGKWTVALEDANSGTYLFHMPVAPKLVESSGCLLDAMGDEDQKSDSKEEEPKKEDEQKKEEDAKKEEQETQEDAKKEDEQKKKEDAKKEEDAQKEEQKKKEDAKNEEETKKDEQKDDKKDSKQKKDGKKEDKKETKEEKKEKEEEAKSKNKDKANVHALLPNYGGGLRATASLSRVTDIRNQLQAKVDQMKADLASKGVTMDMTQEEPEHAAAAAAYSSASGLDHYRSGLSDFDMIGLHSPVPGSLSAPSFSSPPDSSALDSLNLPEVPASSGQHLAEYKPLPPLPDVNDAALDFATHNTDSNLLDDNSGASSFSNSLESPPSAADSLVTAQMKADPYLNTEELHTEVAAGKEPDVFSSLILTATACLASALLAGILIHKCLRKGDELNMYVLVEEADEEDF